MGTIASWPSPAKINLFLHINGKREDGYHELQTLFAILDKGDSLSFKELETNEIIIKPDFDFPQEKNIVYKAVQALREFTNVIKGIEITINKNIPMGGGLGGGSSNAATALVALNNIWKLGIDEDNLCKIGRKLGADVPVFIKGRSAFAEGVGEKLTPYVIEESYYLIVTPKNTNVSTKEIFTHPNLPRNTPKFSIDEINSVKLKNDCEELVKNNYPIVAKTLLWLLKYAPSRMTGTGASCFAKFDSKEAAVNALNSMPNELQGFVAKACNYSPLLTFVQQFKDSACTK